MFAKYAVNSFGLSPRTGVATGFSTASRPPARQASLGAKCIFILYFVSVSLRVTPGGSFPSFFFGARPEVLRHFLRGGVRRLVENETRFPSHCSCASSSEAANQQEIS